MRCTNARFRVDRLARSRILHEEWSAPSADETMKTNFEGVITVTNAFWPLLSARPDGIFSVVANRHAERTAAPPAH